MTQYAKVPVEELEALEKARKSLYVFLDRQGLLDKDHLLPELLSITGAIWEIANKRRVECSCDEKGEV